jgi:hypothetical protein
LKSVPLSAFLQSVGSLRLINYNVSEDSTISSETIRQANFIEIYTTQVYIRWQHPFLHFFAFLKSVPLSAFLQSVGSLRLINYNVSEDSTISSETIRQANFIEIRCLEWCLFFLVFQQMYSLYLPSRVI